MACMVRRLVPAAILVGISVTPAAAVDQEGRFAVEGIGAVNCAFFLQARADDSGDYKRLLGWLEGFATGANLYEQNTFDATPWQTTGVLTVITENHCKVNPDDQFALVVQRLLGSFMDQRLQASSSLVEATASGSTVQIYRDVLRKAQIELAKRGLYQRLPTGEYNMQTQQAFAAFQKSEGLASTGLPDQTTLWKLMAP